MKHIGLERDLNNEDIPENHSIDAKNGVNSKIRGASINEGGFKVHQKANTSTSHKYGLPVTLGGTSYKRRPIGEIFIDDGSFVIFSLGYTATPSSTGLYSFSEIGLLKADGEYIPVINDYSNTEKFNFNADFPYTGEFTRNYLNEINIIATDDNNNPLYFNLTKLLLTAPIYSFVLNDFSMFPNVNPVNVAITVNDAGGSLENGVYYLSYVYENEDFSISSTGLFDKPISIFNAPLGNTIASFKTVKGDLDLQNTSKSISLTLYDVNTNFKNLKILAIIKRNGVSYSKYIGYLPITGSTLTYTITSSEQIGETISLKEALTPTLKFKKVYKFTQVYNRLYAARTTTNSLRTFQKYANLVNLKWETQILSPLAGNSPARKEYNYDNRTFLHKEVYAFYIHLVLTDGTVTEGFHIPYNRLNSAAITSAGYRAASTLATDQDMAAYKFQLEDTCTLVSTSGTPHTVARGELGFWENQNETYPSTADWDSSAIGGEDLRGQKVRHHRFPSINWMKQNAFNYDTYGTSQLDQLGISAYNVTIPVDIAPFVKSWFISYAQRDYNNSTVIGQSILLYESKSKYSTEQYFSGFNLKTEDSDGGLPILWGTSPITPTQITGVTRTVVRFYDLNLLKNTVDINPDYLSNELLLETLWDFDNVTNCINNSNLNGNNAASFFTNYIEKTGGTSLSSHNIGGLDVRYRKLNSYRYLSSNVIDGEWLNNTLENTLLLDVKTDTSIKYMPINTNNDIISWFNSNISGDSWATIRQQTYLSTLMRLPSDTYNSLESQKLVTCTGYIDVTVDGVEYVFGGDGFTNYYSFHTGGWGGVSQDNVFPSTSPALVMLYDNGDDYKGVRNLFTHVCETITNLALKSSDNTVASDRFYPESAGSYIHDLNREILHVNTLYNNDYSSIANMSNLIPYQFNKEFADLDYYKINRTIAQQAESVDIGWRTWLANDYYIAPRNKGKITNIDGYDRSLIIHTENALMFTVGNEELKIDASNAFVGSGNIFERPAYELAPSKEGSFGTKNRFSCIVSPYGYFAIDAERGIMFLLGKSGQGFDVDIISDKGLKRWLYDNLQYETDLGVTPSTIINGDNPYTGFGYTVGYDSEFKRLIISKKVYELTQEGKNYIGVGYLEHLNQRWILNGSSEITFDNTTYFTSKCFTLSYDLDAKKFTFFHDYHPNKLFNSRNEIFCFKEKEVSNSQDNRVFKLNQNNKGIYDNTTIVDIDSGTESATPYPFYIVPVINHEKNSFKTVNLSWITRVFNNSGALLPQETFTKVLAFNSYQSTPDTETVIFNFTNYFDANIRNIKNEWFYNKLRDYLVATNYNSGTPFINNYSELNSSLIDMSKAFEKIRPLEDKWLAVKFTYDNVNQNEIHILQISTIITPVNR